MNKIALAVAAESLRYMFTTQALTLTRPTAWYMALYSSTPAAGSEATGEITTAAFASYARQPITFALAGQTVTSSDAQTWTVDAGATPPAIVAVGIFDALTGGNCLAVASIAPITAAASENISFAAGATTINES